MSISLLGGAAESAEEINCKRNREIFQLITMVDSV